MAPVQYQLLYCGGGRAELVVLAWLFLEVTDSIVHRKDIDFGHVSLISNAVFTNSAISIANVCSNHGRGYPDP